MKFNLGDKVVTEKGNVVVIQGFNIHSFNGKTVIKYITSGGGFEESTLKKYVEKKESESYSFSRALRFLKDGKKVQRKGWNNTFLMIVFADDVAYTKEFVDRLNSECENSWYITIKTHDGVLVPWQPNSSSLLANDWIIYEGEKK
ncbi:MAG TPA: DUF2829 domain-containing protein [Caldisericia bacterium]|nr:DUF2829 domain-containing protein [Caldisericia bacterium]